ncbi:MAG: signal peptidase II, partial [Nanoarchaeota archaeon]|nr:signal peptidase II [Nanoarchaeota archaeon]
FITSLLIILLDQITKYFFQNKTFPITSFFKFNYVENTGAAFGMLKGFNPLFIIVGIIVILVILKYYKEIKKEKKYVHLALGFLLGGVLGNLIDRLFLGYVRDFIAFSFWPTFNLADTFSTIAVIILAFHILIKK